MPDVTQDPFDPASIDADTSIPDDFLGVVYDVALDPARYVELCTAWDRIFWKHSGPANLDTFAPEFVAHFYRAESILDLLVDDFGGSQAAEFEQFLGDLTTAAALVIDKSLKVAGINPAATALFSVQTGDDVDDLPIVEADKISLIKRVRAMLSSPDLEDAIFRVRSKESARLIVFQLRSMTTANKERYVTAVTSDIHWPDNYEDTLKHAFALSKAEADIVRLIVDCKSIADVAEMRGRSIGTVRNQVKSILGKTGLRSQIELVRLVMSVMEVTTTFDRRPDTEAHETRITIGGLKQAEQKFIVGPDGRRLEYLILGDRGGAPVFYLQSELGLVRLPAFIEEMAAQRELRIISPIRAGYGNSDPIPKGVDFITQVSADLLTVLDAEGIQSLPVISIAADNTFGAGMHYLRPGSVTALIATSGCYPFADDTQAARQHPMHRLMHSTAKYLPALLPFVAKAAFKAVRRLGKKWMVEKMFASSPADLEIFAHPDVEEAVLVGSDVALSETKSAHDAFMLQCLSYHTPGTFEVMDSLVGVVPLHSLNGLKDPSVPAETLAEHQERYDWIDFRIYPDAGQWLFFKYPADVFDLVERYISR